MIGVLREEFLKGFLGKRPAFVLIQPQGELVIIVAFVGSHGTERHEESGGEENREEQATGKQGKTTHFKSRNFWPTSTRIRTNDTPETTSLCLAGYYP